MGIQIEDAKVTKANEGSSALYLSKEAHDDIEAVIEALKKADKQIPGIKMTKKGLFECAAKEFREMIEATLAKKPAVEKAEDAAAATAPTHAEEVIPEKNEKTKSKK